MIENHGTHHLQRTLKCIVTIVASAYVLLALAIYASRCSSAVVVDDAWHMQHYLQFAQGNHNYYEANDLHRSYDGYTPLASQIFGWTIRYIADDIRATRAVAGLFGFGAIILIGLMTYKISKNRWLGFVSAGMACSIEPTWFMDVGPNTIHVFFALLGAWLLIRDNKVSSLTVIVSTTAFFLCFWAKQTGIIYLAVALLYILQRNLKKGIIASVVACIVISCSVLYYESLPDSRFIYLAFKWAQHQPIIWNRLWNQLLPLFSQKYGISTAAAIMFAALNFRDKSIRRSPLIFLLAGALFVGLYTSCKYGSGLNQAWFLMCLLIILTCSVYGQTACSNTNHSILLYTLLLIQAIALYTDPRPFFITSGDETRFAKIMTILKTPQKETYYVNAGYLSHLLGKTMYANVGHDCWLNKEYHREIYPEKWSDFLKTNPWDIVIIDVPLEDGSFKLYEMLNQSYKAVEEVPADSHFPQSNRLRFKKIVFQRK